MVPWATHVMRLIRSPPHPNMFSKNGVKVSEKVLWRNLAVEPLIKRWEQKGCFFPRTKPPAYMLLRVWSNCYYFSFFHPRLQIPGSVLADIFLIEQTTNSKMCEVQHIWVLWGQTGSIYRWGNGCLQGWTDLTKVTQIVFKESWYPVWIHLLEESKFNLKQLESTCLYFLFLLFFCKDLLISLSPSPGTMSST